MKDKKYIQSEEIYLKKCMYRIFSIVIEKYQVNIFNLNCNLY